MIAHLCSTATWQALRDEAGLTGAQAGEAVAHTIRTLLNAASTPSRKSKRKGPE